MGSNVSGSLQMVGLSRQSDAGFAHRGVVRATDRGCLCLDLSNVYVGHRLRDRKALASIRTTGQTHLSRFTNECIES